MLQEDGTEPADGRSSSQPRRRRDPSADDPAAAAAPRPALGRSSSRGGVATRPRTIQQPRRRRDPFGTIQLSQRSTEISRNGPRLRPQAMIVALGLFVGVAAVPALLAVADDVSLRRNRRDLANRLADGDYALVGGGFDDEMIG